MGFMGCLAGTAGHTLCSDPMHARSCSLQGHECSAEGGQRGIGTQLCREG